MTEDDDLDIVVVDSHHCTDEHPEQRSTDQISERDQRVTSCHLRRGRRKTRGCIGSSLPTGNQVLAFMTRNTTCKVDAHDAVPALHGERISNPLGLSAGMRKCPAPLRREVPSRANAVARAAEKPAARGQRRVAARAQPRALHQSER